jgi:hypothetical protein
MVFVGVKNNRHFRIREIQNEVLKKLYGFITQTKVLPPASVGYLSFLICEPDKPGQNATDS